MDAQNELKNAWVSEHIRAMSLIHLIWALLGGWGVLGVLVYWLIYRDKFAPSDTSVFYEIINFNLSFFIYFAVSAPLCLILIGFLMIGVFALLYFIFLVSSTIKLLDGKEYQFPMTIHFLK